MDLGKALRLQKLRNPYGFFFFLAADHQLTRGRMEELGDFSKWLTFVNQTPGLSGIVINVGAFRYISTDFRKEVIPQLMGGPAPDGTSVRKVRVGSVLETLALGASLVSTQLNFEEPRFLEQIELFQDIRCEANRYGLPTMIMINIQDRSAFNANRFADYLTYAAELGGDIIKIGLPEGAASNPEYTRALLENLPPVVLSGDDKRSDFINQVDLSKACGFSGLCIGRNIFRHHAPREIVDQVCTIFATKI